MTRLTDQDIVALRAVLATQDRLVRGLCADLSAAEHALAGVAGQRGALAELERLMAELEVNANLLEADDMAAFDADAIPRLYEARRAAVSRARTRLGTDDWPTYVRTCQASLLANGIDPLTPYEALLTPDDLRQLRDESYDAQLCWDAWDYTLVGVSGMLAALTDVLLVRTPQTSPLTTWIKTYHRATADNWFGRWARALEESCRVPYDAQATFDGTRIPGMSGRSHRVQSLGHDPVLGFVFGVLDILRGTVTGFSYNHLQGQHTWIMQPSPGLGQERELIAALLRHLGHLISDVATPAGLPAPLLGLFQGINAGSFGPKGRTVGQVARWMYLNGYDLRHFLVGGLSPAVVEIVLRGGLMLRHYAAHGETVLDLTQHPKYRTMLLAAHGIAALGNAGKITLMQGNPLAINLAQWYALVGYVVPSMHFWLFDAHRLRLEHLRQITEPAWDALVRSSDLLLSRVVALDSATISLGSSL
ncbi:MAG: hypothetical protein WCG26_02850 [Chloroflexales bacterium]